jgi:hypothetical protein
MSVDKKSIFNKKSGWMKRFSLLATKRIELLMPTVTMNCSYKPE